MPSLPDMGTPDVMALARAAADAQPHSHDPHVADLALRPAFFDWLCRMGDNTLILGPGGLKFGDYWRLGLSLEIVVVLVAVPMLLWV